MNVDWIYQLIMACAIGSGVLLSRLSRKRMRLPAWQRYGVLAGAFCGAMLGAKLPFIFVTTDGKSIDWNLIISGAVWFRDGKTILCGLVGGYIGVEIAKWSLGVIAKTGDSFAMPVAVSVCIGRLGCFHAGCCYGIPTDQPWGVVFDSVDTLARHPTQIYESLFHGFAAIALVAIQRRDLFTGNLVKLYIASYAVYRFCTEFIRPEAHLVMGITGYQILSIVIVGFMLTLWSRDRARNGGNVASGDVVSDQNSNSSISASSYSGRNR